MIVTNGKFPETVSNVLEEALLIVEDWCLKEDLSVNPKKTKLVAFTNGGALSQGGCSINSRHFVA